MRRRQSAASCTAGCAPHWQPAAQRANSGNPLPGPKKPKAAWTLVLPEAVGRHTGSQPPPGTNARVTLSDVAARRAASQCAQRPAQRAPQAPASQA
jgi:hypothetical protein